MLISVVVFGPLVRLSERVRLPIIERKGETMPMEETQLKSVIIAWCVRLFGCHMYVYHIWRQLTSHIFDVACVCPYRSSGLLGMFLTQPHVVRSSNPARFIGQAAQRHTG